ncbi:hypothetical protein ILYODFUR_017707 [Ilyodon furcidens]|uniref:Secreted protein n=1 Tax=Ilyodon furcidens TaxID=33524 RepID=A0ABV0UHX8_9TELE
MPSARRRLLRCVIMTQLLMFFLLLCSAPAFLDCYTLLSCVITVHSSRFVMSASALIYPPCSFAQVASDCVFTLSCDKIEYVRRNTPGPPTSKMNPAPLVGGCERAPWGKRFCFFLPG